MALAYYTNGPRADRTMDLPAYPRDAFFREVLTYTPDQLADLASAIALSVYYMDNMKTGTQADYHEQFAFLVTRLPDSLNSRWVRLLITEILVYNACMDEADGRDFIVTKFCKEAFGNPIPVHSTWNVVTV